MLLVKLYNPVKLDPGKGVLKGNLDSTSSLNHQVLFILTCRSLQNSHWHVHSFLSTEIIRQDNQVCYHKPLKRNTHMHTFFLGCGMAVFCFSHKLYKDRENLTNLSSVLHWRLKKKREEKNPSCTDGWRFLTCSALCAVTTGPPAVLHCPDRCSKKHLGKLFAQGLCAADKR